ncbi:MAG: ABC transporter substrate-binding protein, partial [Acetanaerobacterium sp.]
MCTKSQTLLSFILVIVLAALSACAPVTDAPSTAPEETSLPQEPVSVAPVAPLDGRLLIPYDKDDSLNPYQATSALNLALHSLVYDSLVKLDNDFTPVMSLASDIDIDGTRCTVTIKNGIHFSDGTPLTAMDVRYSIDCIRLSSSVYANRLSNIAGYSVQDEHTLVITLSSPDSLFVNLLDFPVIQSGTYSSDRPVGNGRYVYDGEPNELDGGEIRLTANDQWHGDDIETFKE